MSANGSQTSKPCTKCYETKPLEDFHRELFEIHSSQVSRVSRGIRSGHPRRAA